jgi:hypothetical protein
MLRDGALKQLLLYQYRFGSSSSRRVGCIPATSRQHDPTL